MSSIAEQAQALEQSLRNIQHLAVAFSGGLDSRFLIHAALRAGVPVQALHVAGPHIPAAEHEHALAWAHRRRVPLTVLPLDPLTMPALRGNPKDRCYHCKTAVFTALKAAAAALPGNPVLADGTNASDSQGYRPGLRALAELGIISPLAEAGLTKDAIRRLAADTGLDDPGQAALPCLLTRFDYGLAITAEKLQALDVAERAVEAVLRVHYGPTTPGFRLRWPTQDSTVLHVEAKDLPPALVQDLREALAATGFARTPVEAVRTLSGYFDRI